MATDVVQFREDANTLAYLRARGISPNTFGREAFQAALRRLRSEEAMARLARAKVRLPRPIEDIIREDRDNH
ncbi:MAG TPA: hypothetical protein VGR28_08060 [Candidatus Thermoplasmatota archaeon]|jgi:hypothetical protein|nr:hypothetical protein [Candidatus Thermoplasmatota archaeon]